MANIFDLTGTTVAANYRKVSPSTQLGTRALRIVKVSIASSPDLVTDSGLSDSYFSKAVLQMQNYGETWAIGAPADMTGGVYAFVMIFSDDTAQDSAVGSNVVTIRGTWAQAEAAVAASLGAGTVTITDQIFSGTGLIDKPNVS